MKRTALWLAGVLLLCTFGTVPLVAEPQKPRRTDVPAALAAAAAEDPSLKEALASRPLFFALSADQLSAEVQQVEFRILLNGQLHLQESLAVAPDAGSGSALELLASRPDLRDRLYDLSRDRANQLQIQVLLSGQVVGDFPSFADFVRYNREIKQKGISPRFVPSQVLDLTAAATPASPKGIRSIREAGYQKDPACVQQCDEEWAWNVNTYGCDYGDCSRWDLEREACLQRCPTVCVDPKKVTEPTYTELVGYSAGYSDCYEHWWENDYQTGEWYQQIQYQYKHTKVRRTEYCDGHVEEQVLQVWYSYGTCWNRSYFTCYNPWTKIYNTCN